MRERTALLGCLTLSGLLLLGACGERAGGNRSEARQTNFPGQIAAGSKSSGEIMERSRETIKSQMPSGTPGIPEGAGGNTSGPAMGGTSPGAAVAGDAPKGKMAGETQAAGPDASAAKPSAAEQAAAKAQKEKQELAASMDEVTRRWRADAAKNGWNTYPAVGHDAVAGISASGAQEQTHAVPPVHSEKSGSAAPSEDVKKPKEPGAN
jgi:hypothetical protein